MTAVNDCLLGYVVSIEVSSGNYEDVFKTAVNPNRTTWMCSTGQCCCIVVMFGLVISKVISVSSFFCNKLEKKLFPALSCFGNS